MMIELVTIIVTMLALALMYTGGQGFGLAIAGFIDIPALICILMLSLPILAKGGLWNDFTRAFRLMNKKYSCRLCEMRRTKDAVELMQKQILFAGVITTISPFIYILHNITELSLIGPNISVALIAILYTAFLELLLLPLQVEVKKRIINYMEEE